ncbi:MAG TPA: hypothetical protein PLX03_09110, partial [Candidatus Hydrogenedentes bacterium]|nr:hypothetical protein [Candidatus Hydrogenedentota bacterium]
EGGTIASNPSAPLKNNHTASPAEGGRPPNPTERDRLRGEYPPQEPVPHAAPNNASAKPARGGSVTKSDRFARNSAQIREQTPAVDPAGTKEGTVRQRPPVGEEVSLLAPVMNLFPGSFVVELPERKVSLSAVPPDLDLHEEDLSGGEDLDD